LIVGVDGKGADFGDSFRIYLKGAAADDFAFAGRDEEGRHAREIALNELIREEADQSADGGHVFFAGWAHGERHSLQDGTCDPSCMAPTGPERDPRIYMAVERTFLAWIRTGLSLMGFGFVVARFGLFLRELSEVALDQSVRVTGFSMWAGTMMVLVGVVVNVVAAVQHVKTIRHLNAGVDITGKPSTTGVVLSLLMAAAGLTMAMYLMLFR